MLKQLTREDLDQLLMQIAADYHLQVPQLLADGTRQLAAYGQGEISLAGKTLQRKPTSSFFAQTETLVSLPSSGVPQVPQKSEKPVALFGLDDVDLAGIAFLDRFFMAAPADDLYLRKRETALLIALTGAAGPDNAFLPLTSAPCDLELISIRGSWLAQGYSEEGKQRLENFTGGDAERLAALQKFSASLPKSNESLLKASRLLRDNQVPDPFWEEIAASCIACGGCNFVCPTCSCFCVQDRTTAAGTERSRVWDSCQLDAFMREASGHNPLGSAALRTRRRIHHKLAADVDRWGELGCVACGRCDRSCPTGIGMLAVVENMLQQFDA